MLQKITNLIPTTYDAGDGFRIDVVSDPKEHEIWIYHKDYAVKMLMFGIPTDQQYGDLIKILEANMEEYKDIYKKEYFD